MGATAAMTMCRQLFLTILVHDTEFAPRYKTEIDFPPVQTGPGAHPASCTMGIRSFQGVKYGRGVLLTTHPLLVPWSWKSRAIPIPTLWATTRPVTGTTLLYFTLYDGNIRFRRNICTFLQDYTMSYLKYVNITRENFTFFSDRL